MNFEDLKACCDRLLDFCGSCCGYPNECGKCEVPIVEGFTVDDHKNEPGHAADRKKPAAAHLIVMCEEVKMRKVVVYKYQKVEGSAHFDRVPDGHGIFHQFGIDYQEFESGPGNFTTAVVEMPDGNVKNIPVELISFVEKIT